MGRVNLAATSPIDEIDFSNGQAVSKAEIIVTVGIVRPMGVYLG